MLYVERLVRRQVKEESRVDLLHAIVNLSV